MSKKKPDNTILADQLKSIRSKMVADEAAASEAAKRATARATEEKIRARAEAEEKLSDEERFARAVTGMARREVLRKFEEPPPKKGAPAAPAPKPVSDDDVFLRAMSGGTGPAPARGKDGKE